MFLNNLSFMPRMAAAEAPPDHSRVTYGYINIPQLLAVFRALNTSKNILIVLSIHLD